MYLKANSSLIKQLVSFAIGLLVLNCSGALTKDNAGETDCVTSDAIDVNDTALLKTIIDSVYASDEIDWAADFKDLDTTDLVHFASIREYIPSLNPNSMTKIFGACVEEDSICYDDSPWYESDEAIRNGWTKESGIKADLIDMHFHINYDKLIPILSKIEGKWKVSRKMWSFDDNHFIMMYYVSPDNSSYTNTLVPIDGIIIHKEHPIWEFE